MLTPRELAAYAKNATSGPEDSPEPHERCVLPGAEILGDFCTNGSEILGLSFWVWLVIVGACVCCSCSFLGYAVCCSRKDKKNRKSLEVPELVRRSHDSARELRRQQEELAGQQKELAKLRAANKRLRASIMLDRQQNGGAGGRARARESFPKRLQSLERTASYKQMQRDVDEYSRKVRLARNARGPPPRPPAVSATPSMRIRLEHVRRATMSPHPLAGTGTPTSTPGVGGVTRPPAVTWGERDWTRGPAGSGMSARDVNGDVVEMLVPMAIRPELQDTKTELPDAPTEKIELAFNVHGRPAIALYSYDAKDGDELDLTEGDALEVLSEPDEGQWVMVTKDGCQGFVPADWIHILPPKLAEASARVLGTPLPPGSTAQEYEDEEAGGAGA